MVMNSHFDTALKEKAHLLQVIQFLHHYMQSEDMAVYWQCSERQLQARLWEIISHLDTLLADEVCFFLIIQF